MIDLSEYFPSAISEKKSDDIKNNLYQTTQERKHNNQDISINLPGYFTDVIPEKKYSRLDDIRDKLYQRTQKRKHDEQEIVESNIKKIAIEIEEAKKINQNIEDTDQKTCWRNKNKRGIARETLEMKLSQMRKKGTD